MKSMPSLDYKAIQGSLNIRFKKRTLLNLALTHSSYRDPQNKKKKSNETLEFLGDAVLELVVREFLYIKYPDAQEGELSELKKRYTCTEALYRTGKRLHLGKFMIMDKGEEHTGGRNRPTNIAGCLEAIIGALYLDRGLVYVAKFVQCILLKKRVAKHKDYKSALNRWAMQHRKSIGYRIVKEEGAPHKKKFLVNLYINKRKASQGSGSTKKKAEQEAAKTFFQKKSKLKMENVK